MIGKVMNVPNGPGFVIVKRAAEDLVGAGAARNRARPARLAGSPRDQAQALAVDVADHRGDETAELEVDRDAEMDVVVDDEARRRPRSR